MCCTTKSGWTDTSNECDGTFGGSNYHECALKPGNIYSSLNCVNSLQFIFIYLIIYTDLFPLYSVRFVRNAFQKYVSY